MDSKLFFLIGILAVSLALVPSSTAEPTEEPEDAFEDVPFPDDDDDLIETPGNQNEEVYHYTSEDIERNRWISLSHDGVETTETDEEVIRILDYARHDNATSRDSESFNFTSDELDEKTTKEKRTIIGYDSRYKYPRYGLRGKTCALGILENGCTAFLIGPRHAVTSGHCVYNTRTRTWNRNLGIYLGRDCRRYGRFIDWSRAWVFRSYINGDARSNMAYILLSRTASCWLSYGYQDPMPRTHFETCGYHSDRSSIYRCYYCSHCYAELERTRSWLTTTTYYTRMRYQCDIYEAPGSPMVTNSGSVWGVHGQRSSSYNYAARITREKFYTLCRWKCDTGSRCSALC